MTLKSFSDIFSRAKQQDEYWVADAIYTFAEEYHKLFVSEDISKAELAKRTRTSPAYIDRKSTRLNSSHIPLSRMPSSA